MIYKQKMLQKILKGARQHKLRTTTNKHYKQHMQHHKEAMEKKEQGGNVHTKEGRKERQGRRAPKQA